MVQHTDHKERKNKLLEHNHGELSTKTEAKECISKVFTQVQ